MFMVLTSKIALIHTQEHTLQVCSYSHKRKTLMTYAEKVKAYHESKYQCSVPSVCTAYWNTDNWIAHIDRSGEWLHKSYTLVAPKSTSEYTSKRDVFYMFHCFVSYAIPCKVVDNETQQTIASFLEQELL